MKSKKEDLEETVTPEITIEEIDVAHRASQQPTQPSPEEDASVPSGTLEKQVAELTDQLLRRRAEFENYKKRAENERMEFTKYASERMIIDLLPILDSFERALQSVTGSDETKSLYEGFTLIHKQMLDALVKQGMTEIKTNGEKFDPNYHQAVSQEKADGIDSGKIVKVYQKGYLLHKRVIRPSMVVVAE